MKLLNRLTVGAKLTSSFIAVAFVVVLGTVVGLFGMKTINDSNQVLYADRILPNQALATASEHLNSIPGDIYKYLIIPNRQENDILSNSNPPNCASCHTAETNNATHAPGSISANGIKNCTSCYEKSISHHPGVELLIPVKMSMIIQIDKTN